LWRIYYFITGRKIRRIMTKTAKAAVNAPELRVLCNFCSIRIAPNEEQVEMDRKTYHQRCYAKTKPRQGIHDQEVKNE